MILLNTNKPFQMGTAVLTLCKAIRYLEKYFFILFLIGYFFNNLYAEENLNLPPSPTKIKAIHLPAYKTFTLKNGLKVYLIEDHKHPSVSYFLYLDYLPRVQAKTAGLGEVTTKLMKQGTKKKTKNEMDEELDFMGADLSIQENLIFANTLSKYSEQILEIMSDIIKSPRMDKEELLRVKDEMVSNIQADKLNPEAIAGNIERSLLYGKKHSYGEIPTEKSISSIQVSDCKKYHETYFNPNIAHLAIMGDITIDEAKKIASTHLESWTAQKLPKQTIQVIPKSKKTRIYLMDRPDSVQSVIKVTNNINLKLGDKDLYSAVVMNTILGGGTFRLYQNLREKHGYTYGVYSSLRPDKHIGNFSIDMNTENSVTHKSIKEIFYELNRIRRYKIKPSELQLVKNYLSGQFSLSLENPGTIALYAIKSSVHHLPIEYYDNYLLEINKISESDVMEAARKYIRPKKTNIIVVGRKKDLRTGLKSLKKFRIVDVNRERLEK